MLKEVIPKLILYNQTVYANSHYIGGENCLTRDTLECTTENETEAILFSADFEWAFGSIEYTFIFCNSALFWIWPSRYSVDQRFFV